MPFDEDNLTPEVIEDILGKVEAELKLDISQQKTIIFFFSLCRGTEHSRSLKETVLC